MSPLRSPKLIRIAVDGGDRTILIGYGKAPRAAVADQAASANIWLTAGTE
jgi:hypothetical protein